MALNAKLLVAVIAGIVVASALSYSYIIPSQNTAEKIFQSPEAKQQQPLAPAPEVPAAQAPPVVEEVKGDFSLEFERRSIVAQKNYTDTLTIRVRVTPDFNSRASFFAEGLPDGVSIRFSPQETSSPTNVVARIQVGDNVKEGVYKLSIGAKSGKLVKTELLSLDIIENLIVIQGYRFPPTYTVKVGAKITWLNKDVGAQEDPGAHTMTDTKGRFDSGLIYNGQTWSYTFNEPGTYRYWCRPHPAMFGEIVVVP